MALLISNSHANKLLSARHKSRPKAAEDWSEKKMERERKRERENGRLRSVFVVSARLVGQKQAGEQEREKERKRFA